MPPGKWPTGLDFRAAPRRNVVLPGAEKVFHDRIRRLDDEVIVSIGAPRRQPSLSACGKSSERPDKLEVNFRRFSLVLVEWTFSYFQIFCRKRSISIGLI